MNQLTVLKKLGLIGSSFFFILLVSFSFIRLKNLNLSTLDHLTETEHLAKHLNDENEEFRLEHSLLDLLSLFVEAHKSLTEENQEQFLVHIEDILQQISKVNILDEESMVYHEKLYLYKQLESISEDIRLITLDHISVDQRMKHLKQAYKDLISISQSYALNQKSNNEWSFYFCSQDSSLWVQNSNLKKHNPFDKGYQNCGQRIQ